MPVPSGIETKVACDVDGRYSGMAVSRHGEASVGSRAIQQLNIQSLTSVQPLFPRLMSTWKHARHSSLLQISSQLAQRFASCGRFHFHPLGAVHRSRGREQRYKALDQCGVTQNGIAQGGIGKPSFDGSLGKAF
jgi:hypothetical protein